MHRSSLNGVDLTGLTEGDAMARQYAELESGHTHEALCWMAGKAR
jgi:hypothetical protein